MNWLYQEPPRSSRLILITTDQNLRYQQNLATRQIAIVVLMSTSWLRIQQQTEQIQVVIDNIRVGEYQEIVM